MSEAESGTLQMPVSSQINDDAGKISAPAPIDSPEDDILTTATLFCGDGRVHEVRCLNGRNILRGYYDDPVKLAEDARKVESRYKGTYITLNPVNPDLLSRSPNKMGTGEATKDADITNYEWFYVDVDAGQNSDTNSTDAEHIAALKRAQEIAGFCKKQGFPEPLTADSGNGAHLLWKVDLPVTVENKELVKTCLDALASEFPELSPLEPDSKRGVHVDTGNFNPSRIAKLYGTKVCKGTNSEERPWRRSGIISIPLRLEHVNKELLMELSRKAPDVTTSSGPNKGLRGKPKTACRLNLKNYLDAMGHSYSEKLQPDGRVVFNLKDFCIVSQEKHGGCYAVQFTDGGAFVECKHNHCQPGYNHAREVWVRDRPIISEHSPDLLPGIEPLRPEVIVNRQDLALFTDNLITALKEANNPPVLFSQGRRAIRIVTDEHSQCIMETGDADIVANELERMVKFVEFKPLNKKETIEWKKIQVWHSNTLIRNLLAESNLPFPTLIGITEVPMFTPNDKLVTKAGYNIETEYYYVPDPLLELPVIPEHPTIDQIKAAKTLLYEVLCDFQFEDEGSKTNAIAAMLTAVLFPMIDGCIPLALFDKPQLGCGGTLLARICGILMTGREPVFMQPESDEDKWDKAYEGALLSGVPFIVWDNLNGPILSKKLDSCLTAKFVKIRLLGGHVMVNVSTKAFHGVTGSNIRLDQDTVRRAYLIRITTDVACPWERTEFQHQFPEWIFEQRGNLLAAIYTLVYAWIDEGKTPPDISKVPKKGSFNEWHDIIGGILHVAEIDGFLSNSETLHKNTDLGRGEWVQYLQSWYNLQESIYPGSHGVLVRELVGWFEIGKNAPVETTEHELFVEFYNDTPTAIRDQIDAGHTNKIGNILAKNRDAIYGTYQMKMKEFGGRKKVWRVDKIGDNAIKQIQTELATLPIS